MKTLFSRAIIYGLIILFGLLCALPNVLPDAVSDKLPAWYTQNQLTLGLDLRGGSHLLLEVDTSELVANKNPVLHEQIVRDAVEQSLEVVRRRLDETGMVEPMITRQGSDSILVQLPGVSDPQHIRELLGTTAAIACFTQAIAHSIVTITQIAVAAIGGNQTVQRIVAEALVVGVVEAGLKLSFYCLNWAPKLEVLPDRWWH